MFFLKVHIVQYSQSTVPYSTLQNSRVQYNIDTSYNISNAGPNHAYNCVGHIFFSGLSPDLLQSLRNSKFPELFIGKFGKVQLSQLALCLDTMI